MVRWWGEVFRRTVLDRPMYDNNAARAGGEEDRTFASHFCIMIFTRILLVSVDTAGRRRYKTDL